MGQVWEGTSPRWAGAPPPPRPKAQGEWEGANPRSRWALRPTLVAPPSLFPLAAPFLGGRGKAAPSPSPLALYIVGGWEDNDT